MVLLRQQNGKPKKKIFYCVHSSKCDEINSTTHCLLVYESHSIAHSQRWSVTLTRNRLNVKKQTLDGKLITANCSFHLISNHSILTNRRLMPSKDAYAVPANFLEIDVVNPMTTITAGKRRYTDYEVRMRVCFCISYSSFSVFIHVVWRVILRCKVKNVSAISKKIAKTVNPDDFIWTCYPFTYQFMKYVNFANRDIFLINWAFRYVLIISTKA